MLHMLVAANHATAVIWRGLFAYQICMRVRPRPSLEPLLRVAHIESSIRVRSLDAVR